jgi:uncharacterized membrane protein
MEEWFSRIANVVALAIEMAAVAVVAIGAIEGFVRTMALVAGRVSHGGRKDVWQRFGVWLLLALEFTLAADIVRSAVAPSWPAIGKLGAIAVIRTFLNFFLEKDIEKYAEMRP